MAHNSLSMYFLHVVYSLLHCHTIVQILHTVNNVEVTVNTCTCTDVITTKDQSGGIYSTGGQGFMAVVSKPRPRATPSDSVCLLP